MRGIISVSPSEARPAWSRVKPPEPRRPIVAVEGVREVLRAPLRVSPMPGRRVNLIVPSVGEAATYAGIQTALDLFEAVAAPEGLRRIISVKAVAAADLARLSGYSLIHGPLDPTDRRQIISLAGPPDEAVPIRRDDVFIATHWRTAAYIMEIRRMQAATFGSAPTWFAYLIQDYEPGFYPWSAQHLLARMTYEDPSSTIAVFNTTLLRDYFRAAGLRFPHEFTFEPRLPRPLWSSMARPPVPRERRILVYGRPGKPRNLFPFIVDGLRRWRDATPGAESWAVVSAGESHPDVDLGAGVWMRSLGKLDLPTYADLLRTSAIGISMMASPHPSHPPIEMAQLGLLVLTNRFDQKDLARWHTNITSLGMFSADGFRADLADLCRRFDADPTGGERGVLLHRELLDEGPQFPFADEIAGLLRDG